MSRGPNQPVHPQVIEPDVNDFIAKIAPGERGTSVTGETIRGPAPSPASGGTASAEVKGGYNALDQSPRSFELTKDKWETPLASS